MAMAGAASSSRLRHWRGYALKCLRHCIEYRAFLVDILGLGPLDNLVKMTLRFDHGQHIGKNQSIMFSADFSALGEGGPGRGTACGPEIPESTSSALIIEAWHPLPRAPLRFRVRFGAAL